jgi:hypothetical protein
MNESTEAVKSASEVRRYWTTEEKRRPKLTLNIEIPGRALVGLEGAIDAEIARAVIESLQG